MKKYTILILISLSAFVVRSQTTATDFTANDCNGVSHHLFAELDAGKIIVVAFVDPCASCIAPSLGAQTTVQGYATSNPGRVLFYISDDLANTPCHTLISWANTNGMSGIPIFSDPTFRELDYGALGMPKIVALGGTDHKVYYMEDFTLNTTNLQTAINSALAASAVPNVEKENIGLSIFPNPAADNISLSYSLVQQADVTIDIYNTIGSKVLSVADAKQTAGDHKLLVDLNSSFTSGIYFLVLHAGESSAASRFVVER